MLRKSLTPTLLVMLAVPALAQVTLEITGATSTQAVLSIRGATSPCSIHLREGSPDGPIHPDVNGVVDESRPDTLVASDGSRLVTLGHQRANLALAAATDWYGTVYGCVNLPQSFSFRTAAPATGANWPRPVPFNADRSGNLDYPPIDWSPAGRGKAYVDPTTGVKLRLMDHPGDFGWRSNITLDYWTGGEGWTSPGNALNGWPPSWPPPPAPTVASTSGTNPLDLYSTTALGSNDILRALDNLGLVVYGSGTEGGGGAEDRAVEICIVTDPSRGCAGEPFRVTLPTGSSVRVDGSPNDPDRAWPQGFPFALFSGWGGATVNRDRWVMPVTGVTASNGTLTLNPTAANYFPMALNPGNRIRVPGSGCLPSELCTVASVQNAGSITVSETVNGTSMAATSYPWSIRVRKVTSSGSISVGFRLKMSGSRQSNTVAAGFQCHPAEVVTADNIRGHSCAIPASSFSERTLYFVSNDGAVVRRLGLFRIPHSKLGTMPAADRPYTGTIIAASSPFGSGDDARVFYVTSATAAGIQCVYKVVYKGDWVREVSYPYNGGFWGDFPETDEQMEWTNVTPPSQGKDLNSLVRAGFPNYNETIYGNWNSNTSFGGMSGSRAFFYKMYSGQDGGPCWVATLDLEQGALVSLVHTLDGTGLPAAQWGACHSVYGTTWPPKTVSMIFNILASNNTSKLHGGPFEVKPAAIMRNGSWSSNTALPWPIDTSYDTQCPTNISQEYKDFGATGNQCFTAKFPGHPCNIAPSALEKANFPACNWNGNFTQPALLRPGSHIYDPNVIHGPDSEHFLVVQVTELAGGELQVVMQRNASWDWCCFNGSRPGANCVATLSAQFQHTANWTGRMNAGGKNACHNAVMFATFNNDRSVSYVDLINAYGASHYNVGRNGDNVNFITLGSAKYNVPLQELGAYPARANQIGPPSFSGVTAPVGGTVQQYPSVSQNAATNPTDLEWAIDSNAYNPGSGYSNSIGARAISQVSGDVWKIGVIGAVNYKKLPLIGWVGSRILQDASGANSNIASAPGYSFCHALRAGECVSGSAAGETFVNAPRIYPSPDCLTGSGWANSPCVATAQPGVGGVRQYAISNSDPAGQKSRFLTYGFGAPGFPGAYYTSSAHPSGKSVMIPSGFRVEEVRNVVVLAELPEFRLDTAVRNEFGGLTVRLPERPGATQARVRFGYDTKLRCSQRDEACLTDSSTEGFSFESFATGAAACSAGCEIQVPALSGRLLYYQAEWLDSGNQLVETSDKSAVVIP